MTQKSSRIDQQSNNLGYMLSARSNFTVNPNIEHIKTSVFCRSKSPPRGVQKQKMRLALSPSGGYYNPKVNEREPKVDLTAILQRQEE